MSKSDSSDADLSGVLEIVRENVRQRLDGGENIAYVRADVRRRLRPDPPVSGSRLRDDGRDGPPKAPWRLPGTPLLGLHHLPWRPASDIEKAALSELWHKADTKPPSVIYVADADWLNGYHPFHAVFGSVEADYDLLGAADFAGSKPIVFDGTGSSVIELARKAKVALAAHGAAYVHLFLSVTASPSSRFAVIDRDDLCQGRRESVPIDLDSAEGRRMSEILAKCGPIEMIGLDPKGALRFSAHVLYDHHLYRAELELAHDGSVIMVRDDPLWPLSTAEPNRS